MLTRNSLSEYAFVRRYPLRLVGLVRQLVGKIVFFSEGSCVTLIGCIRSLVVNSVVNSN